MRVVHISYKYGLGSGVGGAAIAASRLHNALLQANIDSHFVCVMQMEPGYNVHSILPVFNGETGLRRFLLTTGVRNSRFCRIVSYLYVFGAKSLSCIPFLYKRNLYVAPHILHLPGIGRLIKELNPDVIHFHWLNTESLSFGQLRSLISQWDTKASIIVNLHDFYMINAWEPYPGKDLRFCEGFTKGNSTVVERWLFNSKKRALSSPHVTFVAPSEWAAMLCRRSIIGRGKRSFACSNIIDPSYAQSYRNAKRKKIDKCRLLFGAVGGRHNPNKGWRFVVEALNLIEKDVTKELEVWVFGEESQPMTINSVGIYFQGNRNNAKQLLESYTAADIFLFPSVQETQGMTKCEAMICGLPVIAFDRTACAEMIDHMRTGWVAKTVEEFAEGIRYFWRLWKNGGINHAKISESAMELYNSEGILARIIEIYGNANPHKVSVTVR